MRRFSRLLLIALVAVVIGFYPLLAPTSHRIDQAHFRLIRGGMTRADVEAIFGVPPGKYDWAEADDESDARYIRYLSAARLAQQERLAQQAAIEGVIAFLGSRKAGVNETWVSRHGAFIVGFDQDRVVFTSSGQGVRMVPPWQRWWKAIRER
jgi:hypothetical protein